MKESGTFDITSKLPLLKNISLKKSEPRKSAFDDKQEFQVEYIDPVSGEVPSEIPQKIPVELPKEVPVDIPREQPQVVQKPKFQQQPQAQPQQPVKEIPVIQVTETTEEPEVDQEPQDERFRVARQIWDVIRILALAAYRLRAVFLAIPVIFLALRLAAYNSEHLPLLVGLDLQSTGEFAKTISRQTAVTMPLFLTGGCLTLMCFSRKPLYPWLISLFSLVVPILLLLTNMYPA